LGFKDKKPLAFSVYRAITHFFSDKDGKQVVVKLEEPILIKTLLESHLKDLRNRKKKNDKNKKS